jgi:hypothetical protein
VAAGELPERGLVDLWERGAAEGPAGRARLLLAAARPDWPAEALDTAGLGERDAWLLELRRRAFGDEVRAVVACPACGTELTVTLPAAQLRFEPPATKPAGRRDVAVSAGGYEVRARTPDGTDLRAAAECGDVTGVRAALVARCVVGARGTGGEPVAAGELPDDVVAAVGDALAERDPQSEVLLDLVCAVCGRGWGAVFDVTRFLWAEVAAAAERVVDDVAALARAYGWTEEQSLALSPWRRRRYLDKAAHG